jgi:hypothetical protein
MRKKGRNPVAVVQTEQGVRPEIVMQHTGHNDIKTMMKDVKITSKIYTH